MGPCLYQLTADLDGYMPAITNCFSIHYNKKIAQKDAFWAIESYEMAIYVLKVCIWDQKLANPWNLPLMWYRMSTVSAFYVRTAICIRKIATKRHFGL